MNGSTPTSHLSTRVPAEPFWSQICVAAESPDFCSKEFVRLVLMQMCLACQELGKAAEHSSNAFKVGPLVAQIRALGELVATARLASELTVQEDVVNLDGAKFAFVFNRLFQVFRESVDEAGCGNWWNTICRLLADNLAKAEPEIRRDIENAHKMGESQKLAWSQAKSITSQ